MMPKQRSGKDGIKTIKTHIDRNLCEMESINFNDFTEKERRKIIEAFLIKMKQADKMESAHDFFQHYLKQFYKIPRKLQDDIIYCQRAMKNYLSVHQTISNVFAEQADTDPATRNNYLIEVKDVLHEISAECQYLTLQLEEDIDRFCLPFTKQNMKPNENLINEMVSKALVPPICSANHVEAKPHFVKERPTESQLLCRYFTVGTDTNAKQTKSSTAANPKRKPLASTAPNNQETTATPKPVAVAATPIPDATTKANVVNASRMHLQAALEQARLNKSRNDSKLQSSKEKFLKSFDLCTQLECKRIILNQALSQKPKFIPK